VAAQLVRPWVCSSTVTSLSPLKATYLKQSFAPIMIHLRASRVLRVLLRLVEARASKVLCVPLGLVEMRVSTER
jgi:hypothetical protein